MNKEWGSSKSSVVDCLFKVMAYHGLPFLVSCKKQVDFEICASVLWLNIHQALWVMERRRDFCVLSEF